MATASWEAWFCFWFCSLPIPGAHDTAMDGMDDMASTGTAMCVHAQWHCKEPPPPPLLLLLGGNCGRCKYLNGRVYVGHPFVLDSLCPEAGKAQEHKTLLLTPDLYAHPKSWLVSAHFLYAYMHTASRRHPSTLTRESNVSSVKSCSLVYLGKAKHVIIQQKRREMRRPYVGETHFAPASMNGLAIPHTYALVQQRSRTTYTHFSSRHS